MIAGGRVVLNGGVPFIRNQQQWLTGVAGVMVLNSTSNTSAAPAREGFGDLYRSKVISTREMLAVTAVQSDRSPSSHTVSDYGPILPSGKSFFRSAWRLSRSGLHQRLTLKSRIRYPE